MRDSEILQAKMAVRLLSGHKDELEAWQSLKAPEPAVGREGAELVVTTGEPQRFPRL